MAEIRRVAGVNPLAIQQASMLDDMFFSNAEAVFDADLVKKTSAVVILGDIKRCFSKEIRSAWPRFDTGRTEDGEIDFTCNNPDWTKTINGKRTVWVSYFDTIVLRAAKAMAILAEIENKKDIAKQEKKRFVAVEIEAEIKTLTDQLSTYKQTFRKAIKLCQQEETANELYPEMKLKYRTDSEGNVKQIAEPIMIHPQELPGEVVNLTVTQFMSLDFSVVVGETDPQKKWDALVATMTREKKEEEEDEDNIEINNWPRFETGAASMLSLLESGTFTTRMYAMWDKAKDIAPHADMIKTLVDLSIELNAIAQKLQAPKTGKGERSSLYARAIEVETDVTEEAEAVTAAAS